MRCTTPAHRSPSSAAQTRERIAAVLPEFGSVTNPIDGTGAIYDDPALLPKLIDAIVADPGRPMVAASVSAHPAGSEIMRRFARTIADAARNSGRTVVAYQYSPLGGPLDPRSSRRCTPRGCRSCSASRTP